MWTSVRFSARREWIEISAGTSQADLFRNPACVLSSQLCFSKYHRLAGAFETRVLHSGKRSEGGAVLWNTRSCVWAGTRRCDTACILQASVFLLRTPCACCALHTSQDSTLPSSWAAIHWTKPPNSMFQGSVKASATSHAGLITAKDLQALNRLSYLTGRSEQTSVRIAIYPLEAGPRHLKMRMKVFSRRTPRKA